ncbi:dTMP kinase [Nonomuraea sp. NPDC050451]|uniref:dTMP kinase n=1 Tax=Nonomuraea sp. NPDC050451 TaxID=3364364 RepID=UPI0037B7610F
MASGSHNLFVVLEGVDGSGKTTVRKHLFRHLMDSGHEVLSIQGASWMAAESTRVIVEARFLGWPHPPEEILQAYLDEKTALTDRLLGPHLVHRSVVCDRYVHSDVVYASTTWGIPVEVSYPRYLAAPIRRPDLVLFLDAPPEVSLRRLAASRRPDDIHPWERLDKLRRNYELFQNVIFDSAAPLAPSARIDCSRPLAAVCDEALRLVRERFAESEENDG